jgi:hypothetical protein
MTDETQVTTTPPYEPHPTGAPPVGANLGTTPPPVTPETPAEDESTVGMGTSIALGCVAATIVLIIIGLLVLFIANLIG